MTNTLRPLIISLVVLIAITTIFIRLPLPGRGYFNFGDIAVIFSGLICATYKPKTSWIHPILIAGTGSAIADIVGGFAIFAPITFIAKGCEAFFAFKSLSEIKTTEYAMLVLSALSMVGVYFIGEWGMPSMGLQQAIPELIPNIIQVIGGIIGGKITFNIYKKLILSDN